MQNNALLHDFSPASTYYHLILAYQQQSKCTTPKKKDYPRDPRDNREHGNLP